MLGKYIHRRERFLSSIDTNRVIRPFDWGTEFLDIEPLPDEDDASLVDRFVTRALDDSDAYYATPALDHVEFDGERVRFESALASRWDVDRKSVV